ncbi:MAG: DUF1835 domain-containing protein [Neorhizobium sp.]|nr:DUF1835 domain-containing protein [Neorhizobium sp.]
MTTLHIAPGDSAAGTLRQALQIADQDDEVLAYRDDLSCGPIGTDDLKARVEWWQQDLDWPELEEDLRSFWERVKTTDKRIVVWFGGHSARELAFRLAWASRMRNRPYHLIDVTGLRIPIRRRDGSSGTTEPAKAVSIIPADVLATLIGNQQSSSAEVELKCQQEWTRLKSENAPCRIVSEIGPISAQDNHFDRLILDSANMEWKNGVRGRHRSRCGCQTVFSGR